MGMPLQSPTNPARPIRAFGEVYDWNGSLYVPFHSVPAAAGRFLSPSIDSVEQHLRLPPEHEFCHGIWDEYVNGHRTHRRRLAAARVRGDSMMDRDIHDGDVIIFQRSGFEYVEHGKVVVIERIGEEEGFGAWSLKRLVIEQSRSSSRNEFEEEIDWNDPVVVLRSHNRRVSPWQLDPSGRYRIRGVFLRSLCPKDVHLVESEWLQRAVADEKILPE
jgi:Peptidase S24-like